MCFQHLYSDNCIHSICMSKMRSFYKTLKINLTYLSCIYGRCFCLIILSTNILHSWNSKVGFLIFTRSSSTKLSNSKLKFWFIVDLINLSLNNININFIYFQYFSLIDIIINFINNLIIVKSMLNNSPTIWIIYLPRDWKFTWFKNKFRTHFF